jgi:hypothetical protein
MRRNQEITGDDDPIVPELDENRTPRSFQGTDDDGENPTEAMAQAAAESESEEADAISADAPDAVELLGVAESPEDEYLRMEAERQRELLEARFAGVDAPEAERNVSEGRPEAAYERERRRNEERRQSGERRAKPRGGPDRRRVERRENASEASRSG